MDTKTKYMIIIEVTTIMGKYYQIKKWTWLWLKHWNNQEKFNQNTKPPKKIK